MRSRQDHDSQVAKHLGEAPGEPVLGHDENAETIAGIEQFRGVRIVGCAESVAAEFLELLDSKFMEPIGQGDADAGVVAVIAHAFDFQGLAVEEETALGVPAEGADAEGGFVGVDDLCAALQGGAELVEIGFVTRPEAGILDRDCLDHFDLGPRRQFDRTLHVTRASGPCERSTHGPEARDTGDDFGNEVKRRRLVRFVEDCGSDGYIGTAFGDFAGDKRSLRRDDAADWF